MQEKTTWTYRIVVQGRLDESWEGWFSDFEITVAKDTAGITFTTLTGYVTDQSALRGILNKLWDLNLTLVWIKRMDKEKKAGA
jgi:hypothetical protein